MVTKTRKTRPLKRGRVEQQIEQLTPVAQRQ
jgi:hypothetical protein